MSLQLQGVTGKYTPFLPPDTPHIFRTFIMGPSVEYFPEIYTPPVMLWVVALLLINCRFWFGHQASLIDIPVKFIPLCLSVYLTILLLAYPGHSSRIELKS